VLLIEDALMQQSYQRNGGTTASVGSRVSPEMTFFEPYLTQWALEVDR